MHSFRITAATLLIACTCVHAADLNLYGADGTFLGCLSCSPSDSKSVWNESGSYGSRFSRTSIWSGSSNWGSSFGSQSPWNTSASRYPRVMEGSSSFKGYFTCNSFPSNRFRPSAMNALCRDRSHADRNRRATWERYFR